MNQSSKQISLFICLFFVSISLSAQWGWGWGSGMSGEGPVVTKTIDLENIDGLSLGVPGNVYLMKGNKQKIEIKAQKNIIDNIERSVRNGIWKIEFDKKVRKMDKLEFYITLPSFRALAIAGSGGIIGEDAFNLDNLEISIAGSGDIDLEGTANGLEISIAGSGDINLKHLEAENCEVSIAGSGDCEVNVSERLDVSIAGSGDVKYKGNPAKVKSSIAGSGDVRSF